MGIKFIVHNKYKNIITYKYMYMSEMYSKNVHIYVTFKTAK